MFSSVSFLGVAQKTTLSMTIAGGYHKGKSPCNKECTWQVGEINLSVCLS